MSKISLSFVVIFQKITMPMITHYLIIAFRNMWKHKSQTLISVIGLAVGFTCFALSTLWIRYETSFDSFHKNTKQMYVVYMPRISSVSGYSRDVSYRMSSYLKKTFPEVADAVSLNNINFPSGKLTVEGVDVPVMVVTADSSFLRMFDVEILTGSRDFLVPGSNKLAITREKAHQLFGNENPIGKTVNTLTSQITPTSTEFTICAVVKEKSKRSNYTFDFIKSFNERTVSVSNKYFSEMANAIIELFPGTNIKAFEKKLYEHNVTLNENNPDNRLIIRPITKIYYTDPEIKREVKFQHILIFSVSGILVILCSLFNYLTLFISRFRIRQKELTLRMVCGASGRSLLTMLSVEFILTLLFAVLLGCMVTQLVQKPFLTLSKIQMSLPDIYRESLIYIGGVILVSFIVFWLILFIFRKRSLNVSIRRSNRNLSRKVSVIVQLVISIVFAFCTIVILKQMYFLHHTDELGFSFKNMGSVTVEGPRGSEGVLTNYLKQIPEITETIDAGSSVDLFNPALIFSYTAETWDDKPADIEPFVFDQMGITPEYIRFYDLKLTAGEFLDDIDSDSLVLINESAVKVFGWHKPVGKHIDRYTVKGVIKNLYNLAPTIEAKPIIYTKGYRRPIRVVDGEGQSFSIRLVLFKYQEGMWKSCKEKIEQIIQKEEYTNALTKTISNYEETYNNFLKSENALIKLLSVVSATCILICLFGFVSLVSLTCEERRKSIAIRKVNGATSGDILDMFAKEYSTLLIIGAVIAFTTGYFIMQRWLENYVKQTSIPAWIYLSIIFVMAFVIILCVGWQVYKASVENPAEVVKK